MTLAYSVCDWCGWEGYRRAQCPMCSSDARPVLLSKREHDAMRAELDLLMDEEGAAEMVLADCGS